MKRMEGIEGIYRHKTDSKKPNLGLVGRTKLLTDNAPYYIVRKIVAGESHHTFVTPIAELDNNYELISSRTNDNKNGYQYR